MATLDGRVSKLEEAVKNIIDPERIKAIEVKQEEHEKANNLALLTLANRVEEAHGVAMESREMSVQTNSLVAQMPEQIMKAIREESKAKKFEKRDWMFLFVAIVSAAGTIGALLK